MTLEQAEAIAEAMEEDGRDVEVRADYSGRGMYGKTVAGLVCSRGDEMLLGFYAAKAGLDADDLPTRSDSMGLDVIFY